MASPLWHVLCGTTRHKVGRVLPQPTQSSRPFHVHLACSGLARRRRGYNPAGSRTNGGGSASSLSVVVGRSKGARRRDGNKSKGGVLFWSSATNLLAQRQQKLEVCRCTSGGIQGAPGPGEKKDRSRMPPLPSLESVLAHLQRNFMPYGLLPEFISACFIYLF